MRAVPIHGHHQVGNDMPKLRAACLEPRETVGEGGDGGASGVLPHRRTDQRAVLGEAVDDGRRVTRIQRTGVAHEQIVDAETILDRWSCHGHDFSSGSGRKPMICSKRSE